jgi:glycosyltransferase involved in cell wall biosynthesis
MRLTVSVCVPATRTHGLGSLIRSIATQTHQDWELIVLGQGDEAALRAATVAATGEGDQRVRYVHLNGFGLSMARNAALVHARGEVLAFVDDDCDADTGWLQVIAGAFASDHTIGLVGGALLAPRRRGHVLAFCPEVRPAEALYDPGLTPQRPPPGWDWYGGNFAVRAEVIADTGPWDECLGAGAVFPAAEDTDFKLRLERRGIRMLSTPRAVVHHSGGVRVGRAALRGSRAYARGNGALAAKLTLGGDRRGEQWLRRTREGSEAGAGRGVSRWPSRVYRYRHFARAYRECLDAFELEADGTLRRRRLGWTP